MQDSWGTQPHKSQKVIYLHSCDRASSMVPDYVVEMNKHGRQTMAEWTSHSSVLPPPSLPDSPIPLHPTPISLKSWVKVTIKSSHRIDIVSVKWLKEVVYILVMSLDLGVSKTCI